jgi:hypothetical protein
MPQLEPLIPAFMGLCIFAIIMTLAVMMATWPQVPAQPAAELRRLKRVKCDARAVVCWHDEVESKGHAHAEVVDITEYGARMRAGAAIHPGTWVYIEIPERRIATTAHVRWCQSNWGKFLLGMEFRGPMYPAA